MAILCAIFIVLLLQINRRISSGHSGDFRHFYFAAGALLDHRDLYGPVPDEVIERALDRPENKVEKNWYTVDSERYLYPPLIAMLYTPLARLRFDIAQRVILVINTLLAFAGVLLTTLSFVERFSLSRTTIMVAGIALVGTLLNLDKIHVELQMFQTNSLMFFCFALSLYMLDRQPILAGIPLGIILNIKYLSLAMIPWLLIRRRWSTAASCVMSTIIFALLPALISGWHANLQNLSVAYGGLLHMIGITHGTVEQANVDDIRDYLSCSITSALARTTARGQSLTLPMLMTGMVVIASALLVVWQYRRKKIAVFAWPNANDQIRQPWHAIIGLEFVSIVAATLCFSPQTNTRHLVLALLITVPISALIFATRWSIAKYALIGAAIVLAVGFIFPPGGQATASRHLEHIWFGIGGQCWCLLLAMFVMVSVGLSKAKEIAAVSQLEHLA